jgi:hypothetical protein
MKKVIYWQARGDKHGFRSGTILPDQGESWPHMATFLGDTDPNVRIYAYTYDLDGHRADEREGDAEQAKTWTWTRGGT